MTQTWKSQIQAVDIEIRYVLRAGLSGLHTYAVVRHPASYPATKFGEWRMVWKPPSDLLDTICVDRLRFRKMPHRRRLRPREAHRHRRDRPAHHRSVGREIRR